MIDALVTMGGSTLTGFALKMLANWQENSAQNHKRLIDRDKIYNDSMDKASSRGNVWMRRFVVFVMISLFAFLSVGITEPTNIVKDVAGDSYFWGLVQFKPETIVIPVMGTIRDETLLVSVMAIISFLFGVDVADKK